MSGCASATWVKVEKTGQYWYGYFEGYDGAPQTWVTCSTGGTPNPYPGINAAPAVSGGEIAGIAALMVIVFIIVFGGGAVLVRAAHRYDASIAAARAQQPDSSPPAPHPQRVDGMKADIEIFNQRIVRSRVAMSEEELSIVRDAGFNKRVIDSEPMFSQTEVKRRREEYETQIETATDNAKATFLRRRMTEEIQVMQSTKRQTTVADLLKPSFTREFDTPDEARKYVHQLEGKLRQLKTEIEDHRANGSRHTIEL